MAQKIALHQQPESRNAKKKSKPREKYKLPGAQRHPNRLRRIAGRLGLDFLVAGVKFANRQLGMCARQDSALRIFSIENILTCVVGCYLLLKIMPWKVLSELQCLPQGS